MTRGTTACLLFSACAVSFLGCGGRTDTLFDDGGAGGLISAGGGNQAGNGVGGNGVGDQPSFAGSPSVAGAPANGGSPGAGGSPSHGGSPGISGSPSVGGSPGIGGFPGHGGSPGIAGSPSVGGFSGDAGAGGTGGAIIDACVSLAQTDCNKCLCQVCSNEVIGCFSDLGCASIFACIEKTGCQGLNCYTNQTCRKVINQFGGLTGNSAGEVFSLVSCSVTSQNTCACN